MTIVDLTAERAARFRRAVEAHQQAIDLGAPRSVLDKLQAEVVRHRCNGLGLNIPSMMPRERF